jgi:hypothetical protein
MAELPTPQLVPLRGEKKHYQIVKLTCIPRQVMRENNVILSTLPILFVFVQEVESAPSGAGPSESS